jgi:hypothetical protein
MIPNNEIHNRRSIRLRGYDYSSVGSYFITICVQDKKCIFGKIHNGKMILNEYGKIAHESWKWLEQQYDYIRLYEFVIMPNHFHGIISVVGARGNAPGEPKNDRAGFHPPLQPRIKKIGELVGAFKTVVTNQIKKLNKDAQLI